jgi:hypothetical protein
MLHRFELRGLPEFGLPEHEHQTQQPTREHEYSLVSSFRYRAALHMINDTATVNIMVGYQQPLPMTDSWH